MSLVMFTTQSSCCPDYLITNSVQMCNSDPARIHLHSASNTNCVLSRSRKDIWRQSLLCGQPAQSYRTIYQHQFMKHTDCIRLSARSKLICLLCDQQYIFNPDRVKLDWHHWIAWPKKNLLNASNLGAISYTRRVIAILSWMLLPWQRGLVVVEFV